MKDGKVLLRASRGRKVRETLHGMARERQGSGGGGAGPHRTGKSGKSRWRRVAGGTRGRCGARVPEGEIASEPSSPSRSVMARRRRRNPDNREGEERVIRG